MLFTVVYLSSLLISCFLIPSLITVAYRKRLFDTPDEIRKVHKRFVPNFGGIAIFTGVLFSCSLFVPGQLMNEVHVLLAAGLILFMAGLKDDLVGLTPMIKLIAQLAAALITCVVADLRVTNLNGLFGFYELTYAASLALSLLFIVGIVNAFNLIDGIDGLAGSLGVIFSLFYAFVFYKEGDLGSAYISLSVTGALTGFLFFNITPAKIFMGDSGSLLLGFIAALLSLKFLKLSATPGTMVGPFSVTAGFALVLGVLIIPTFDTIRVFVLRILKNTSPFTADSNHLHHRLLFLGMSHVQATLVLSVINVLFIVLALSFQQLGNTALVGILTGSILLLNGCLSLYLDNFKQRLLSRASSGSTGYFGQETDIKSGDLAARTKIIKNISEN
jgi:UDP-GlcNAc:undecaprenyl-phosphate GlcNAc-1-phosphate transferase